jgi:hypothetical protein
MSTAYAQAQPRARRRRVPWWTPLLGLVPLAAVGAVVGSWDRIQDRLGNDSTPGVAIASARTHPPVKAVVPAPTKPAVKPASVAKVKHAAASPLIVDRSGTAIPFGQGFVGLRGKYVRGRHVRVQSVVGHSVFWVGSTTGRRVLVHLYQDRKARQRIHAGQRLSFIGLVARNPAGAAAVWGVAGDEGASLLGRQGAHLEVVGPTIRFR